MSTHLYLGLSTDERDLLAGTRRHLAATTATQALRDREQQDAVIDRGWWSTVCSLGWSAPLVPEAFGGGSVTGTPMRELGLVAFEQGLLAGPGPLAASNASIAGLVEAAHTSWPGSDVLESVVAGEQVVTWAAGDGTGHWRPFAAQLEVAVGAGEVVVSGVIPRVDVSVRPDLVLVSASSPAGPVQLLLPVDRPGVSVEALDGLDLARRHARVELDEVRLEPAALMSSGDEARSQVERQHQVVSALLAADSCGALTTGFLTTMEWLSNRYTFGRPLSSYQALKHRMADIRLHLEVSYAVSAAALDALDAGAGDAAELSAVAQAYVAEHAPGMFSEFIQLHGGIGVTWEHDLHIYLRRVIANSTLFGSAADHQRSLADDLLKEQEK